MGANLGILNGLSPSRAVEEQLAAGVADIDLDMRLASTFDTVASNSRETILGYGQMCAIASALPGAIHLVLTYENDFTEAMVQNVMAGGDSAARGLVVGMLLGGHHGLDNLNMEWLTGLADYDEIFGCLEKINP